MDRLSGWYKRRAQVLAFTIGFFIALITNVDTVLVANQLWRQPSLRDTLTTQAELFVIQNQNQVEPVSSGQFVLPNAEFNSINLPIGWIGYPQPLNSKGLVAGTNNKSVACAIIPQKGDEIYGIPIAGHCYPITNAPDISDISGWVQKLLGLLITGLAAAQGAPFWFDILKKIVNVRSAGLNPSETPKPVG
jgi:hypothetical protein